MEKPAHTDWSPPPGYLLTWSTHGTWLHGEEAGSVLRRENQWGTPRVAPERARRGAERERMAGPPVVLTVRMRQVAEEAMKRHCAMRGWAIGAMNVRSNHVHVVVVQPKVRPELIVKQLKEWATRDLRDAGLVARAGRVWTAHASTRYLYEKGGVRAAIDYVARWQDGPVDLRGGPLERGREVEA